MATFFDFRINNIIGKGGFATVYNITKKKTNVTYAMKKIKINNLTSYEKNNIINEIKFLYYSTSNYTIQLKYAFIYFNELCLVTEYAENGDIFKLIKEKQRLHSKFSEETIWKYFIQLCIAIQYLHNNNIIHRDIKSANIFIDKNDNIKLGDFGIIKIFEPYNKNTYTHIGTPLYMSPEIYSNKRYNYKVDIWALGCVLYELITLKYAFNANNLQLLKYKIMNGRMDIINSTYSAKLKNIVHKLLNVIPDNRPSINEIVNIDHIKKYIAQNISLENQQDFNMLFYNKNSLPYNKNDWYNIINKYDINSNSIYKNNIGKYDIGKYDIGKYDIVKNNIVKNNIVKNDIVKNNIVKNDIVKNNIVKNDIVKNNIVKNNIVKNNIVKNDIVKNDIVKNSIYKNVIGKTNIYKNDIDYKNDCYDQIIDNEISNINNDISLANEYITDLIKENEKLYMLKKLNYPIKPPNTPKPNNTNPLTNRFNNKLQIKIGSRHEFFP